MTALVFYFQVHQPFRLRRYTFFDIGVHDGYFDDTENARIVRRVADKCYVPMTEVLLAQIEKHAGKFKCAFSVSGTALEQMELWAPDALANFKRLADTGCVEFLCETSHHSLSFLVDRTEFEDQVRAQQKRVKELLGVEPTTFRNTELVVDNRVARWVEELGFKAILGEGADQLLGWRSPHRVYRPEGCERIKLLLRSYKLSDDIAFRFSNRAWSEWPLSADRFAEWVHALPPEEQFVGLFMDFETFGEHQWKETGIFAFMEHLPDAILKDPRFTFATPAEIAERFDPIARLDIPDPVSWADAERDLTAWLGNHMQRAAHEALYSLAPAVRKAAAAGHPELLEKWKKLTTSDHVYYQCTKWFSDGDVHKYFSPYASPHDAFIAFMNVLDDLTRRVAEANAALAPLEPSSTELPTTEAPSAKTPSASPAP
ncbi:MAG: glycoside hydrolase family 57 protein [Planctomycetes bacterium]|nr:glycoside hydrolase family 57 protein [Planctomycetota bacterium]